MVTYSVVPAFASDVSKFGSSLAADTVAGQQEEQPCKQGSSDEVLTTRQAHSILSLHPGAEVVSGSPASE
jgi:hypothetical protein